MARPTGGDSAATYERIIVAAQEHIKAHGIDQFSLRALSKMAGVGLGTITHYFGSRHGVLEACLDSGYEWIAEQTQESLARIASGAPIEDEVEGFTRKYFRQLRQYREFVRARILVTMEKGELPAKRLEGDLLPLIERVASTLSHIDHLRFRLAAHSLELLVARYALHTGVECQHITGADDPDIAVGLVEDHLVAVAKELFLTQRQDG